MRSSRVDLAMVALASSCVHCSPHNVNNRWRSVRITALGAIDQKYLMPQTFIGCKLSGTDVCMLSSTVELHTTIYKANLHKSASAFCLLQAVALPMAHECWFSTAALPCPPVCVHPTNKTNLENTQHKYIRSCQASGHYCIASDGPQKAARVGGKCSGRRCRATAAKIIGQEKVGRECLSVRCTLTHSLQPYGCHAQLA